MLRHYLNRLLPLLLAVTLGGPVSAAHVDPAPLPTEVAGRVLHDLQAGQADPLPEALGRHLDEAGALVRQAEAEEGAPQAGLSATLRMQFAAKRQEVGVLRNEARARFAATRTRLAELGLSGQVAAWDALLKQVESRFDRLDRALAGVQDSRTSHERSGALNQAQAELNTLHIQVKDREASLGSEPLPTFRTGIPAAPQPQPAADRVPEYLSYKDGPGSNQYAFLGNILLAAGPSPIPGEASSCSYATADLAPTLEVQITPEIQALAEKLGYSPVRIYQYVANEIAFEPYYGSLKGALGTLYSKAGGPTDQASLLIALLRASNIPARYVKGSIQISDGSNRGQEGRGPRWLGAKSYAAAASILAQGLNPAAGSVTSGGQPVGIGLAHVWVEACVPYGNYRGTGVDKTGFRWIPLDPSFKDKTYQAGIATSVNFDYAGYLATRSNQLPQEKYAQQVEAAIKGVAPNYANNTLQDAGYAGKAVPRVVDILPATLPYTVISFTAWPGSTSAEAAALPDAHRYQFTLTVNNGAGAALVPALTLPLPQVALNRITLSFKGATASDQTVLDAWKANPDMAAALPCTANVVPVIKVEGVDRTVGTASAGLCTKDNQLTLAITLPELAAPSVNTVTYKNIGAANHHALQGYAFQASNRLLAERAAGLLATVKTTADPNSNPDGIEGEFLHLVGLKYMRYLTGAGQQIGMLDGGSGQSGNHIGLTSTQMKVQYLFDLPYAVYRQGLLVDVPGGLSRNVDLTTGNPVWKTFLLSGYSASAYEAYIWQENARLDAVSTVRSLQYARETGIEVLTLTSANWAAESPKLTSNANAALNYSAAHVTSIKTAYIDAGYTLTIPRSLIQYQDWKGAVFVSEKNTLAVDNQARAGYAINQYAGGFTTGPVQPSLFNPTLDSGYALSLSQVPLGSFSTLTSGVGLGNSAYNTYAGDPVHMVTGNLYHTERDLSIKGRGGLPLVFERSYNSRAASDGPLGYGWTHSFNHTLAFSDDNANGITDPADSDGITSSVTWTDGSGAQRFIRVAGTAGGVGAGSAFTAPQGFFFQTARQGDGRYTLREKNGLTYTFESVAGTVGQKARLLGIADRTGNALALNYAGSLLSSVSDALGRSLSFSYAGGRISQISDWTGRAHQYQYDASGNLSTYKNPLAVVGQQNPVSYAYFSAGDGINLNHAMRSYTLPRGNGMSFEYYSNGKVFRHATTLGETTTFTYNDFRRETVQTNPRGHERRFFFDPYGNPVRIVEENGAQRRYSYDPANPYNRLTKTGPQGYQTQYAYDTQGNVTRITNPSGATVEFSYFTSFNQPGKAKDARGNYTLYKYDAQGNPTQEIRLKAGLGATLDPAAYTPAPADLVAWTINTHDAYGNRLSSKRVRDFTTQAGPTLEVGYDAQGLNATTLTRRGDKNGDGLIAAGEADSASLAYDPLGRLTQGIDPAWHPTQTRYDAVDRIIQATDPLGNLRDYTFDPNGNPAGQRLTLSQNGAPTLIDQAWASFDASDRTDHTLDAAGNVTAYQYDAAGNVIRLTTPDNTTLAFDYDENNHAVKAWDQEGHAVSQTLDLTGRPRTVTDPNGNTVRYDYHDSSKDGRLKSTTDAAGRTTAYDHDAAGNLIAVTDNLGRTTLTRYDELGRPTRIAGPQYTDAVYGAIRPLTRYSYDTLGNLTQISAGRTDSSGTNAASDTVTPQQTTQYDDFGRTLKNTDALGKAWQYRYDLHNNITQTTDPKGQITQAAWGTGHQLLSVKNSTTGTPLISYARNPLGQATAAQSPGVTYSYSYDTAHRLQTVNDARGNKTLTYAYSPGGLLNAMGDSDGRSTSYLYDPVGRLTGLWAPNGDLVTFLRDAGGRLTEKWLQSGSAGGANSRYQYNPDNTLKQVLNRAPNGATLSQHDYTYDGTGNRQTHAEQINGASTNYSYTYDELGRLTQVNTGSQSESYAYDPLNNRTGKTAGSATLAYVYDAANQLKEIRQNSPAGTLLASLGYDPNGNLIQKTEGATATTLGYDILNRLTQVQKSGLPTQSYQYDDQGRRISKTVGTTATSYLYNGPDILGEYATWTTPTASYVHGPQVDDPLIRYTATAAQYYHQDGLGSVVAVSDASGALSGSSRYDAWGNRIAASGTVPQYGYTGREPDETGLIYYRARYYDPAVGRFTQRDPIGLQGGINLYAYVGNNPVNFTDPSGLMIKAYNPNAATGATSYFSNTLALSGMSEGLTSGAQSLAGQGAAPQNPSTFTIGQQGSGASSSESFQVAANTYRPGCGSDGAGCIGGGGGSGGGGGGLGGGGGASSSGGATGTTGFLGSQRLQIQNPPYQPGRNDAATIGGREYSAHAIDQMQNRGITPSVIENAVQTGVASPGKYPSTTMYLDSVNELRVIINSENGRVITVIPGVK